MPGCSVRWRGRERCRCGAAYRPRPGRLTWSKAFQQKFPQYKVNYTRFVNDDRGNLKLDTALQGGLDIDVYFTYSQGRWRCGPGPGWRRT